jgi:hypothetical protein
MPPPPQLLPFCGECWTPDFPRTAEGLARAQRFTSLLYAWTVCFTKLIRKHRPDVPLSFSHSDWLQVTYEPFCSNPLLYSETFKWHRDTYFIDAEDALRIIRFCPPLPLQPEPDEWKDSPPALL